MALLKDAFLVAKLEGALFRNFPKLRAAVVGIILIPTLYTFIYLMSVWDPASRTSNLPAVVVNLDKGTTVQGKPVNLGTDLARALKEKRAFGFVESADAEAAKRDVRAGRYLFTLIVPADFSAQAMGAASVGAGKLTVYASEGNNYAGAGFAKRFASELTHQLNESINEKRWEAVLGTTASSSDSLARLRDGVARLDAGAGELSVGLSRAHGGSDKLAAGARQLSGGVTQLTDGVKQLGAGAHTLDSKKPSPADLQKIKAGGAQLAAGHTELQSGMVQLQGGADRLVEGANKFREETKGIPLVGGRVSAGAAQLAGGAEQLRAGLGTATEGQARLSAGAQSLSQGVDQLADGFAAYSNGVSTLASSFPPDGKLDELTAGAGKLSAASAQLQQGLGQLDGGAARLRAGIATLASALPSGVQGMPGTAPGLASSVAPVIEIDAPVKNQGQGLAPNFIPVSLWLGAVMTAFIFHLRRLPEAAQGASRASLLLGKMGILGSINLAQTAVLFLMAAFVLQIHIAHAAGLALTMVVASLTFMLILLALVRLFGDTGKAVALILLILQLSAAGGVTPVELTNDFFRTVSPWLPFTWAIKAVRASAFSAFGNEWASALGRLALFGASAFVIAMFAGRWKFVSPADHRPAMDI